MVLRADVKRSKRPLWNMPYEQSGQDKYSTEIVIQGYNSSLTMLGGGNTGGGIQNDTTQQNNIEDSSQVSNDMDDEIPF